MYINTGAYFLFFSANQLKPDFSVLNKITKLLTTEEQKTVHEMCFLA